MRLSVSASDVENGKTTYFGNLSSGEASRAKEYPAVLFGVGDVLASGSFPGVSPGRDRGPVLLGRRPKR